MTKTEMAKAESTEDKVLNLGQGLIGWKIWFWISLCVNTSSEDPGHNPGCIIIYVVPGNLSCQVCSLTP